MSATDFIWPRDRTFIIAEAGVNHNGDVETAMRMVDAARESGVDAVKFQTWKPGECTGRFAFKVDYMKEDGESRYEMSNRLALPYPDFRTIQKHCDRCDIMFLSTPDGFDSLDFLVDELDVPIIKVGSTEITHLEFIEAVAKKGRPVVLSTGLSTLDEIGKCVDLIRKHNDAELVLLQCTSEYPAPDDEVNVRAMVTLAETFGCRVGLSDHSLGPEAAIVAVTLGASVIEKHFTLDKMLPGPDHKASMEPAELAALVESIRKAEKLLGDGEKKPAPSELKNLAGIRRGIVAARDLEKGTVLAKNMLAAKRPFSGIEPFEINKVLGRTLRRDLAADEPLKWNDLE